VRPLRRRFQAVFQDPSTSLDPRLRVATSVAEPLLAHGIGTARSRRDLVLAALDRVGLDGAVADGRPAALSSGQRQRVAIARALVTDPELLVLDEPLASLDAVSQGQILTLLAALGGERSLSMVFISHDLRVVDSIADHVVVMYRGRVVEEGPTAAVLTSPAHPYTLALLAATPDPALGRPPTVPEAVPRPEGWPPTACRYAPRCPRADDDCSREPHLLEVDDGHRSACWRVTS
jgi:peptide/nickel transport system ATP-binding protein